MIDISNNTEHVNIAQGENILQINRLNYTVLLKIEMHLLLVSDSGQRIRWHSSAILMCNKCPVSHSTYSIANTQSVEKAPLIEELYHMCSKMLILHLLITRWIKKTIWRRIHHLLAENRIQNSL